MTPEWMTDVRSPDGPEPVAAPRASGGDAVGAPQATGGDAGVEHFGWMFPGLPPLDSDDDDLERLAATMIERRGSGPWNPAGAVIDPGVPSNSEIPAGFTYLGQFIDHDLTWDDASRLFRREDVTSLPNKRTPRFDLDSVYNGGPARSPRLYREDGVRFRIDRNADGEHDLPRDENGRAVIGDPRNDENLIPVGGRIVAEVCIGLLLADPESFLTVAPGWQPRRGQFGCARDGAFSMSDLLEYLEYPPEGGPQDRAAQSPGPRTGRQAKEDRNGTAARLGREFGRKHGEMSAENMELLDIMRGEADRLNTIVSDFLAYGRPRSPVFQPLNLHESIDEALNLLRRDERCAPSIEVKRDFGALPPTVNADPGQLRQVFWNLFLNAVQAMGPSGVLTVETRTDDGRVRIAVGDTGLGVPTADLPRLFEPFQSRRGGMGLGLATVRRIVEDHRGRVAVESRVGEGTRFLIWLPHGE